VAILGEWGPGGGRRSGRSGEFGSNGTEMLQTGTCDDITVIIGILKFKKEIISMENAKSTRKGKKSKAKRK